MASHWDQTSQPIEPVEVRCRKCNSLLKVASLPAMCPRCRTPVAINNPLPAQPVRPTFQPIADPSSDRAGGEWKLPAWVLPVAGGAVGFLFLVLLIDDLRVRLHRNPTAVATTPTPMSVPTTPSSPTVTPPAISPPISAKNSASIQPSPIVAPATVAVVPPPPPPPPHPFAQLASVHFLKSAPITATTLSDEQISSSIERGVHYLKSRFSNSRLKDDEQLATDRFEGVDTLCAYALLQAGLSISDVDLKPQSPFASGILEQIKKFHLNGLLATYGRSLRLALLSLFSRTEDSGTIENDFAWMLKSEVNGAYTYTYTPSQNKIPRSTEIWDNSNSQYGALGVSAAGDAGFIPAGTYWQQVTQHWETTQQHGGGWGYSSGTPYTSLSMTAAGVAVLFLARDQTAADTGLTDVRPTPISTALQDGLAWLDEGDHSVSLPGENVGYTLYGLERAGLASGSKFFGKHDWYLELGAKTVAEQLTDGSWSGSQGPEVETAFRLLFLSRGRHPIFLSKLRYDGDWSYRPRDVPNLTRYASHQLEVPLNWQTVGLDRSALEWSDSPVLFLSGEKAPTFSDADVEKLGEYIRAGGLLFTLSDRNSDEFDHFVTDLAKRLFPNQPLEKIPESHPIYDSIFALKPDAANPLVGVSNGARLLMVHAPTDLARQWHPRYEKSQNQNLQMGLNVVLYGTGRRDLRHRTETLNVPVPSIPPLATLPLARVSYSGNWDPEPGAWDRMEKLMETNTGLHIDVHPVAASDLQATSTPIAHLTGTDSIRFSANELAGMTRFVADGGTLLIDSCGGAPKFAEAVRQQLLEKLGESPETLSAESPLFDNTGEGMRDLSKPRTRIFAEQQQISGTGQLQIIHHGKGDIIFTPLDLTSGLLGTHTWGIAGYEPDYAQAVVNNVVLWGIRQAGRIEGRAATQP